MDPSLAIKEKIEAIRQAASQASEAIDQISTLSSSAEVAANAAAASSYSLGFGGAVDPFIFKLAIFVLAVFVGYYVVWNVTPSLHTPLMSVTNAISSVIIVGAIIAVGSNINMPENIANISTVNANPNISIGTKLMGFIAIVLAAINIFGGFMVTHRMLAMYKSNNKTKKS